MSSRAYIRIEPQQEQEPDEQGLITYWATASCDDGTEPDEFDFQAPAGLIDEGQFLVPPRAKMWVANALSEQAFNTQDAIDALLPIGRVSLEVGLASDESTHRGGGQRLAWIAQEPLGVIGQDCHTRDVQWALEQGLPEGAPAKPRSRF